MIGRNEGARLEACLASLGTDIDVVYVDSGSSDGSVAAARSAGARVVELNLSQPFTAARARNAGRAAFEEQPDYIQFVDGDCALRDGWIETASAFLDANPQVAVVCGRRRERFPDVSIYNALCDKEWDTPIGEALACGGDALMRRDAFDAVGGFRADVIAGEEPELCVRLRQAGWKIYRLDVEMTWHDAAITRFGQWWKRARRAGHAFAEGAALHGAPPERHWVREMRRSVLWGLMLPILAIGGALIWWPMGFLILVWPVQIVRLAIRDAGPLAWKRVFFSVLGKFPEAQGVLDYHMKRISGRKSAIIEYK